MIVLDMGFALNVIRRVHFVPVLAPISAHNVALDTILMRLITYAQAAVLQVIICQKQYVLSVQQIVNHANTELIYAIVAKTISI